MTMDDKKRAWAARVERLMIAADVSGEPLMAMPVFNGEEMTEMFEVPENVIRMNTSKSTAARMSKWLEKPYATHAAEAHLVAAIAAVAKARRHLSDAVNTGGLSDEIFAEFEFTETKLHSVGARLKSLESILK